MDDRINPYSQDGGVAPRAGRVLIVEDDDSIRSALTEILEHEGFRCNSAASVDFALQLLHSGEFHLVLTDIQIPELDGWHLLRQVTENYPDTAVMMITGLQDIHSAVEALSAGAYDYVTKPFTVAELRTKISRALERRMLLLGNRQTRIYSDHVKEHTAYLEEALQSMEDAYQSVQEAFVDALDDRQQIQAHSKRVAQYTLVLAS